MISNKEICCKIMKIELDRWYTQKLYCDGLLSACIWYDEPTREYFILVRHNPDAFLGRLIKYCPFCGTKLPETLDPDEYILKEYGEDYIRSSSDPQYKALPEKIRKEFDSDEWWKKRGL